MSSTGSTPQVRQRKRPGSHSTPPAVPDPIVPLDITTTPATDAARADDESSYDPGSPIERNHDGTVTANGARELVRARWATEAATRDDLTLLFQTIEMDEGLSLLARMREMCELAARAIEVRRTAENENTACCICKVTRKKLGNRNWRMVRPRRDIKTGTMYTDYFCSDACIVEENRQKHGIAAMSDRGMLPKDAAEQRAKHSIIAHQQKVKSDYELASSAGGGNGTKKPAHE